jgi:pimeloyl-ACP methyl ester carboxylesterase
MYTICILLLIVAIIIAFLFLYRRRKVGGAPLPIILCIPGLGNGAESFDWPTVDSSIPAKIGVYSDRSLRKELTALGWDVRTFDQPDDPGKTIAEYCDWIDREVMRGERADIVMGHSGGAHVANYYASTRHIPAILLDPTPNFVYNTMRDYRRHIEQPDEQKYVKTARYLWMYTEDPSQNLFSVNARRVIIYSDDDSDPRAAEKRAVIEAIPAEKHVRVKNATHWVHITNPDTVIRAIADI